jgi:8-oxo-dGTP pyrophosphatase MutT (NUDIX family)
MTIPSCKVWINNSIPCLFGTSIFESLLAVVAGGSVQQPLTKNEQRNHFDVMPVHIVEHCSSDGGRGDAFVSLLPASIAIDHSAQSNDIHMPSIVPMGRSTQCPTLQEVTRKATIAAKPFSKKQYVNLAVVGMVLDATGENLLITRRPPYMRSFPNAYVFPGGSIDEGETLVEAVSREVYEETGLSIHGWTLESLWESVYPTISEPGVPIQAHHLVCYFSGRLVNDDETLFDSNNDKQQLKLCREEVDGAIWLSRDDISSVLKATTQSNDNQEEGSREVRLLTNNDLTETSFVKLKDLMGIYPQTNESGEYCHGMAQGSLFALEEFMIK